MKYLCLVILWMYIFPPVHGQTGDQKIQLILHQKIPMRDSIHLSAKILKPADRQKHPAIFTMTPYSADGFQETGSYLAQNGYVFLIADVRGRGNSAGEFFPFDHDGQDGYDLCQWIARQPWCNGQVGMMGGSYLGTIQWLIAKEFPPALKSIAPTAAAAPGIDFPMFNNIFSTYDMQWLAFVSGKTKNAELFNDQDFWNQVYLNYYINYIPFVRLDSLAGVQNDMFQKWISHYEFDDYWQSFYPTPEAYKKFDIPILTITGHYDADQPGAMYYYREYMKNTSPEAQKKHFLIIGPWSHGGTRNPKAELRGIKFDQNAIIDMKKLHLDWFDWTLKGKQQPEILQDQVYYYVMGTNQWQYGSDYFKLARDTVNLYLSSQLGASDVFQSGQLVSQPFSQQNPDTLIYDPLDTSPAINYGKNSETPYTDQGYAFEPGKLFYHTAPLADSMVVTGQVKATLFLAMNVPDTDFKLSLYEITQDGTSIYLTNDILRARYRQSLSQAEPVPANKVVKYVFDDFMLSSRTFQKGSRLRLVVECINSPDYQKNYNSGGNINLSGKKEAHTAIIQLYHDQNYPSKLQLPLDDISPKVLD